MRRMLICLLFIVISMTLVPAIWAATTANAGNPFPLIQDLQNQISSLRVTVSQQASSIASLQSTVSQQGATISGLQNKVNAIPETIDMKRCWEITAKGALIQPLVPAPTPPVNTFQSYSGQIFLNITEQTPDGALTGILYRYDYNTTPPSGLVSYPAYGTVLGSSFAIYTTAPEQPPTQSYDEYRYYTGSLRADGSFFGIGCTFRNFFSPSSYPQHQSFNVWLKPSSGCPTP